MFREEAHDGRYPVRGDPDIVVGKGHERSLCRSNARIPRVRQSLPGLEDIAKVGDSSTERLRDTSRTVRGVVVDDDNFISACMKILLGKALEGPGQDSDSIVGAEDDGHVRPYS
jgi:hypothetical protein